MAWRPDILLDNPILVKHVRARLRRKSLLPAVTIVLILCVCILWLGQTRVVGAGVPVSLMIGLQVVVLTFIGAGQVGATMTKARESGIIDFHRVSPLPSNWMVMGFLIGPPILEYALLAVSLPFAYWLALDSLTGIVRYVQLLVALILISWVVHSLVLLSSLTTKKPKSSQRGAATVIVLLALFLGQPIAMGIWFATRSLADAPAMPFFGIGMHWLLFVMLYSISVIAMLLVAATRKIRSERMHAYSKPLAIGCHLLITFLTLGAVWHSQWIGVSVGVLYVLVMAAVILTATITPDRGEYVKGLRRAERIGKKLPSPWSDAGVIRLPLFVLCGIVFVAATLILRLSSDDALLAARGSLAIAVGVFAVAYFGLGLQYFLLRIPKAGMTVMSLFIFIVWLVPPLIGSILAAAKMPPEWYLSISAVSPLVGVAVSSGLIEMPVVESARLAALMPAIFFAVVFNVLVVATRRKIDLVVRSSQPKASEPGVFKEAAPIRRPSVEEASQM